MNKETKISKLKKNQKFVFPGRNITYSYQGKKTKGFFHYVNPANNSDYKTKHDCTIVPVKP